MRQTIDDVIKEMPQAFQAAAASGLTAVYQFQLSGEGGKPFYVAIENGQLKEVKEGVHEKPDITTSMVASDYLGLTNGKLNGMNAFMTGKLKAQGNMMLGMRMDSLFTFSA